MALPSDAVEILGALPAHETVTGFRVLPIQPLVRQPPIQCPDQARLEVFTVPLAHVLDHQPLCHRNPALAGQVRHPMPVPWGLRHLGARRVILRGLASRRRMKMLTFAGGGTRNAMRVNRRSSGAHSVGGRADTLLSMPLADHVDLIRSPS